jgi:hypothetical protein
MGSNAQKPSRRECVSSKDVFDAYEQGDKIPLPTNPSREEDRIPVCLRDISHAEEQSQGNMRIKDI